MQPIAPDTHCAVESLAQNSPIYGTASFTSTWFLLEYNGPWAAKATDDNALPPAVNGWLKKLTQQTPDSRLQFIKHPTRSTVNGFVLYTVTGGALYRLEVADYADLLALEIADLTNLARRTDEQLLLVCTNGKRDWCCGKFGAAAFRHLDTLINEHPIPTRSERLWMTTHLGGHRFAATMVFLPQGLAYGLVQPDELAGLLTAQRQGELLLPRLRGRNHYPKPVQVAEYYLCQTTNLARQDAYTWVETQELEPHHWLVRFRGYDGVMHEVELSAAAAPQPTLVSCFPAKWETELEFRLIQHQRQAL